MVDAWLAACLLYVLHTEGKPPTPAGKLSFREFNELGDFQVAVVADALGGGFFFKLAHPADGSRPKRPAGDGLVSGSVELSPGDCVLLDISAREF